MELMSSFMSCVSYACKGGILILSSGISDLHSMLKIFRVRAIAKTLAFLMS